MKKFLIVLSAATLLLGWTVPGKAAENKKLAQTGFGYLSVISDARAAGMAGAVNSLEMGSGGLFFNPAGLANMKNRLDITASDNAWIADIHHNTFSLAFNPAPNSGNSWGVFGISFQTVNYGDVEWTIVDQANPDGSGFRDMGIITPKAVAFGVGYARALSTQFSIGGQVRFLKQDFGESLIPSSTYVMDGDTLRVKNNVSPVSYDFGTLFKTGYKSLAFGMSVRHFSKEVKYKYGQEGFQLPMVFTIGASMDLFDFICCEGPKQSLLMSVDATHYRSHPEQIIVGLDYTIMQLLSLRAGYVSSNDEDGLSFGIGVSQYGFMLDYAYTPFGVFDKVNRMTARFTL